MNQKTPFTVVRYDKPTILFHWVCAFIVILQFVSANIWGLFRNPLHHHLVVLHLTAGMVLSVLFPIRMIWRMGWGGAISARLTAGWTV